MNNYKLIFIVLLICIIVPACRKENYFNKNKYKVNAGIANDNKHFHYYDFSPDSVLPGSIVENPWGEYDLFLDINNNKEYDLKFKYNVEYRDQYWQHFEVQTLHSDFYIAVEDTVNYPSIFQYSDPIECNLNFKKGKFIFIDILNIVDPATGESFSSTEGLWFDIDRDCLAFKFKTNKNWCLGWLKIGFSHNNSKLVLYEYGYQENINCE